MIERSSIKSYLADINRWLIDVYAVGEHVLYQNKVRDEKNDSYNTSKISISSSKVDVKYSNRYCPLYLRDRDITSHF